MQKNQGEGNREAAKQYNKAAQEHAKSHDPEKEAKAAERSLEKNPQEFKKAEAAGKRRAAEEDPQVKRKH